MGKQVDIPVFPKGLFFYSSVTAASSAARPSISTPFTRTWIPLTATSSSIGITRHLRPSMIRVSTRSTRSGSTWMTTSGVLISNFFVLVMLEATRVDFSQAAISYCSSKDSSLSSCTPQSSKRRFTSDLVSITGSGSSFWASISSFSFS